MFWQHPTHLKYTESPNLQYDCIWRQGFYGGNSISSSEWGSNSIGPAPLNKRKRHQRSLFVHAQKAT